MTGAGDIVVIGVGNEYRADDGAGPAVVAALADLVPADVVLLHSDGEATRLLEAWTGAATVIVIDAVSGGPAPPGTLHRIVVATEPVSSGPVLADLGVSSHNLGVGSAVALARALDRMPSRLIVHGIQGADFGNGVAISPPVAARLDDLTAAVLADIQGAVAARMP